MAKPKNKYDYLAHITLALALLFALTPFIVLFIRLYISEIEFADLLPIFAPALLMLPLSLLSIKFAAKANQTPLALKLKAESENRSESQ